MATDDLTRLLDRLEAALARAEVAAATRSDAPSDVALSDRHERLRDQVAQSVEALGRLLERQDG